MRPYLKTAEVFVGWPKAQREVMASTRIDQYWADILGLPPGSVRQASTVVVPHAKLRKGNFAHVFVRGPTCVISVEEALVEDVCERAAGVPIRDDSDA